MGDLHQTVHTLYPYHIEQKPVTTTPHLMNGYAVLKDVDFDRLKCDLG